MSAVAPKSLGSPSSKSLLVFNDSGVTIYVGDDTVSSTNGIPVLTGTVYVATRETGEAPFDLYAVAAAGTPNIAVGTSGYRVSLSSGSSGGGGVIDVSALATWAKQDEQITKLETIRVLLDVLSATKSVDDLWSALTGTLAVSQGTITTAYNKVLAPAGKVNTYAAPDGTTEVTLAAVIAATGIGAVALIEIQAQGADVYFRTGNIALGSIATAPAAATDGSSARFIPAGGSILIDVSTLNTGRFILKSAGFVTVSFWS